ncbi:MAG TPA: metal-dependent hydrolase [Candidatus Angelobacter sp.]|jgi:hypothetical protein|nr:metal-dependent hydrolase [Candidatus Angelobacter sp.]
MSPITHFFAGWMLASVFPSGSPTTLTRREKALVVAAAVAPDIDGLGIVPELLTRNTSHPLLWFSQYHHTLHTLAFALVCTLAAYLIAGPLATGSFSDFTFGPVIQGRRRSRSFSDFTFGPAIRGPQPLGPPPAHPTPSHPWLTALLVFISFHLHLLCDLIGARGPDGDQWPIPYLKPFSNSIQLTWHGQWALNGWQNFVITALFLLATFWFARKYASSPLELISASANRHLVLALRRRVSPTNT